MDYTLAWIVRITLGHPQQTLKFMIMTIMQLMETHHDYVTVSVFIAINIENDNRPIPTARTSLLVAGCCLHSVNRTTFGPTEADKIQRSSRSLSQLVLCCQFGV